MGKFKFGFSQLSPVVQLILTVVIAVGAAFIFTQMNKVKDGTPGSQGPQGSTGKDGINGINGIKGIKGDQGSSGKDGKDGKDGSKGDQGDQGDQGSSGFSTIQINNNSRNAVKTIVKFDPIPSGGAVYEYTVENGDQSLFLIKNDKYIITFKNDTTTITYTTTTNFPNGGNVIDKYKIIEIPAAINNKITPTIS